MTSVILASGVGWPDVAIALIAGLPGILAAVAGIAVHRQVKTPSGTTIGRQVEDTNHVAIANRHSLVALDERESGMRDRRFGDPHTEET